MFCGTALETAAFKRAVMAFLQMKVTTACR
jgi:hypothetical protein